MKFSVAPESTRATTSALLLTEWMKARTVIDFRADIYTVPSVLLRLISADLIRWIENPQLLPFLVPMHSFLRQSCHRVLRGYVLRGRELGLVRGVDIILKPVEFNEVCAGIPVRAVMGVMTDLAALKAGDIGCAILLGLCHVGSSVVVASRLEVSSLSSSWESASSIGGSGAVEVHRYDHVVHCPRGGRGIESWVGARGPLPSLLRRIIRAIILGWLAIIPILLPLSIVWTRRPKRSSEDGVEGLLGFDYPSEFLFSCVVVLWLSRIHIFA
jgi:hypothetical protein